MLDCIKNKDCKTGFCDEGRCLVPKSYDPCNYVNDLCPNDYKCSSIIGRCVSEHLPKPDGYSCKSDLDCSPDQRCYKSNCIALGVGGDYCSSRRDCKDGYVCDDSKCVSNCDPSSSGRFGCHSGETCVKVSGAVGYCTKKETKPTPPPNSPSDRYSSSSSTWSPLPYIAIFVVFVIVLSIIYVLVKKKKAKGNQFTMQTPLPPAPPTYASPMVAPPQPMYMANAPASPTYMASAPSQSPSYHGPPPGTSPHNYPMGKR